MHKLLKTNKLQNTVIKRCQNYEVHNTFRMKVKCALYVEVTEEADLPALDWDSLPQPLMVIGGGSNLLFTGDYPGTVLHVAITSVPGVISEPTPSTRKPSPTTLHGTSSVTGVTPKMTPGTEVTIGAGVVFDDFCAWAASNNLWGPENLSLIPGEVGASAVQNIGAYGVEAKDIIAGIRAWDLRVRKFVDIDPADCQYGYRTSRFKTEWKGRFIITAVTYKLSIEPKPILDYGGVRKALEDRGVRQVSPGNSAPLCSAPAPPIASCVLSSSESLQASLSSFAPRKELVFNGPLPLPVCGGAHVPGDTCLTPQVIRDTIIAIRRKKLPDPEEVGSAGSFFCNPVISKEHFEQIVAIAKADNGPDYEVPHYVVGDMIKVPAAWMIEQCGFKGATNGGAQVYQNQPLVIVNASGHASPEDVIGLEHTIISTIEKKYGITLHPEVEHL